MSAFLYYFPKLRTLGNVEQIPPECKLGNVLDDATFSPLHVGKGPDDGPGTVAVVDPAPGTGGRQAQVIFDPSKQTWKSIENEDDVTTHWIGWETENPPKPYDLQRPQVTEGLPLNLNGQPYVIPLATLPGTQLTSLPTELVWKRGGVAEELGDRWSALCAKCHKQWNWMRKKEGFEDLDLTDLVMEKYEQFYVACDLLNVNYRVSGPEACALKLLNGTSILYVIRYALGFPFFEAEENFRKKQVVAGNGPPTLSAT